MVRKGYVYTMEVLIALSLILVSLVYVLRYPQTKPELELSLMKEQGFEALEYLNDKGNLKALVKNNNETGLEEQLRIVIPKNINFEAEICISSCSKTNVPDNATVIAMDYYVSGFRNSYFGKRVRLWLWQKF